MLFGFGRKHSPSGVAARQSSIARSCGGFGFPHSDLLSSSGNFTFGNVTEQKGVQ
jgi:hypothetical protein